MTPKFCFSTVLILLFIGTKLSAQMSKYTSSMPDDSVVFEEKNGLVAVEAEYYYRQNNIEVRQWYRTSKNEMPQLQRKADQQHCYCASNYAYLEILPEERVTPSDKLIHGENCSKKTGELAVLRYQVDIGK